MATHTLLLVDKDETDRKTIERIVREQMPDCRLVSCEGGEESLALAKADPPDCAIVDMALDGMDGIELCRQFKDGEATAHFPVLLTATSDADSRLRSSGLGAGAEDFLQRPWEDVDLVAKIRVLLRVKRAEDELRSVNKRLAELAGERSMELQEYDERYRLLLHASSDAVLVLEFTGDPGEGRLVEVNDVLCQWTGYSRDEIFAMTLKDLFPTELVGGIQGRVESILKHKEVFFETRLLARGGYQVPVGMTARAFESGERRTIVAVIRDVSGPPDAREPLRDSVNRYRVLTAQTGQMIYDANVRNGQCKWGGALTQVTGYTPEEMNTFDLLRWRDQIHTEDWQRVLVDLEEAMKAVGKYQLEYRIRHKSGEYRNIEDTGVVLPGDDGKALRILGTLKDITARVAEDDERRRLEQEVQHSQKLESLGVLAGGIAHDFNNILAAIVGLTDMAVRDFPEGSDTHTDLKEVLQAAHRAKELVKQILTFSRQSGEERAPLYLHIVVREALKLLRASLPATIEIMDTVDVHSGAVLANAAQMHQVVMNFCTNAAQAMKDGAGRLEVRLVDEEVSVELAAAHPKLRPGPYVKLSVIDTGHGMEKRVVRRIFDPFFTTKGPGEGTGMGLSVVHGIVTGHGGVIMVESVPGRGTTFHTHLPRVVGEVLDEKEDTSSIPSGTERVLFVDDERSIIRFGESLLPRLGYRATFCASGTDALRAFEADPHGYDLIITDHVMPKMTGHELARKIRAKRPDIPILLFTGFSDDITPEMAKEAGIRDIILKPIIATELAKRIRHVLDATS